MYSNPLLNNKEKVSFCFGKYPSNRYAQVTYIPQYINRMCSAMDFSRTHWSLGYNQDCVIIFLILVLFTAPSVARFCHSTQPCRVTDSWPQHHSPLVERNEARRVGGTDTRPTVAHGLVCDREFAEVVTDHLGLDLHAVHRLPCTIWVQQLNVITAIKEKTFSFAVATLEATRVCILLCTARN